jgi:20S proteasome subunit beta 1
MVHYYAQLFTMSHDNTPPTVHTVAHLFQQICYSNKDALSAGIIVAGWDAQEGGSVWNIPLGGGKFKAKWAIGGSGSSYIYGFCDSTWKEGMSKEATIDFVRDALALAMSRDGSSGGVIRMAVITEEGVERLFVPGDQLPTFNGGAMGAPGAREDLKLAGEMELRTSISVRPVKVA